MSAIFRCPHCRGPLRQASWRLDFFCGPCRMAISIVDEQWAQIMRPSDMTRHLVPISQCRVRATEPLPHGAGTGPLAHSA